MRDIAWMLIVFTLGGCAAAERRDETPPHWGEPVRTADGPELTVTQLREVYEPGQPIRLKLRWRAPQTRPVAISPHLNVVVRQQRSTSDWRVDLPLDGPIRLATGRDFEWTLDLARAVQLRSAGEYEVTIGHDNSISTDAANWRGAVWTKPQRVTIRSVK